MIRLLKKLLVAGLTVSLGLAGAFYWYVSTPLPLRTETVEFHIAPGSSLRVAAREIERAGADFEPVMLALLGRLLRADGAIKAGSYEIERGVSLRDVLRKLTQGDVTQVEIVFIEGSTFRQLRERLNAHPDLQHDTLNLSDAEIMRRIGGDELATAMAPEGWFFPDTYLFSKRSSDLEILARAHRAMRSHLQREWEGRAARLPLTTPYQALILASLVEKETGRPEDRPQIAAVFHNRLRAGMLLQSDPTVIYGLGAHFDGNLRKRDLLADSPYNTYTRAGLPPTPIALPGLASLHAVLQPADSRAFYFVARGDGSSHFSQTLDEHNQAVNRYQRNGR